MRRVIFQAFCVAVLLFGQQVALTHAVSHAARFPARIGTPDAARLSGKHGAPARVDRCALDPVFSSMFGIAHGAPGAIGPVEACGDQPVRRLFSRTGVEPVPFSSRGPPAVR